MVCGEERSCAWQSCVGKMVCMKVMCVFVRAAAVPRGRKTKVDVTKCHTCHAKCPATKPSKRATQCHKCHACHAKRRWMSPSATPATWNEGGCRQVPRLPRKAQVAVTKCHTYHAKRRWMSPSATPATQSAAASPATKPSKRATQCHKCHACHAKRRWMSPSAMPATQNEGRWP